MGDLTPPPMPLRMSMAEDLDLSSISDNAILIFKVSAGKWKALNALAVALTNTTGRLMDSNTALSSNPGILAGTLLNCPKLGNPTKWVPVDDNGTTRYVPMW